MSYELRPVRTPDDWGRLHAIRRKTLFTPDRDVVYDEHHPHDMNPANQCFLLLLDGEPVGVVRLDPRESDEGVVRLVGILPEAQGRGHGRALGELIEAEARRRGIRKLVLNSRDSAVGFYEKSGWHTEVWDPDELAGIASSCVQMAKAI